MSALLATALPLGQDFDPDGMHRGRRVAFLAGGGEIQGQGEGTAASGVRRQPRR